MRRFKTPKKASTVLKRARKWLEPYGRWTRGAIARGPQRQIVQYDSPQACSWCAEGAIELVAGEQCSRFDWDPTKEMSLVQDRAYAFLCSAVNMEANVYNDKARDKRYILRAFDRAIKLAEEQERTKR